MGRPTLFTQERADEIVADIAQGITLAEICRREHMPDRSTVYDWLKLSDEFSQRFVRAREAGFDVIAEECLAIADDKSGDSKIVGEDEREVCNTEFVQRAKLRIETRLKLLAKWDPRRYGDKTTTELTGPNGGPIETRDLGAQLGDLPPEGRAAIRAALQAAMDAK